MKKLLCVLFEIIPEKALAWAWPNYMFNKYFFPPVLLPAIESYHLCL